MKNKKIIIFIFILFAICLLLSSIGFVIRKEKIKEENFINDNSNTSNNNLINKYKCENDECKIIFENDNYIVAYDNDLISYDYNKKEKRILNADVNNKDYFNPIYIDKELYGIEISESKFYNYKMDKITINKSGDYSFSNLSIKKNEMFISCDIFDINKGDQIRSFGKDCYIDTIENDDKMYYTIKSDIDSYDITIYNEKFDNILKTKSYFADILDINNIIYYDGKSINEIDENGSVINSNIAGDVKFIRNGYIGLVRDDRFKLFDYNLKELSEILNFNKEYIISNISFRKDYDGYYLAVIDSSIHDCCLDSDNEYIECDEDYLSSEPCGYYFYYDEEKKTFNKIKSNIVEH